MSNLSAVFRLMRAGWILTREGVISALPVEGLSSLPALGHRIAGFLARPRARQMERSERMSRAMNKLGPSYVKLGQFLATRPDIVGHDVAADLELLQDRLDFFPQAGAVAAIEGSLGRKIDDLYVRFDAPIAAASMAQVHPAEVMKDGAPQKVAVKVIRPGVRQRFARDLESFFMVARMQERHMPFTRRLRPVQVVETLSQTTRIEMDLRLEAAALSEIAENIKGDEGFRVPKVDWERTGRDVLTLEWIDGIKMSDIPALEAAGFDLKKLAETLIQSFLRHTLRDGFFHADMHPGNLFVDHQGLVVAVDFGITGRLDKQQRRFLAEILYGFITRDYMRVAEVHFEAGYVPYTHDVASFAQAIRAIGEPIHGQPAETISMAKLLTLLFEVTELFDMETRPELLMLQKTMVVVEGVSRTLDPHFNMWKAAEPVVGDWIRKNLGPQGMVLDAKESAYALLHFTRKTPELLQRIDRISVALDTMAANGLRFDDATAEAIGRAEAQHSRWGRIAQVVIAVSMAAIAIKLYIWL
ncbi:2-polyprenylphenol 6-hydroxylase [Brucella abortus]|uniref:2-polyprenylphenol 6-hydroxylase n=1 Tax=Brucella abortus TaxID=235 RepID=A0AAE9LFV7_BRUAO|nr:2-polyprenylphenol 6-hydroxylase [Brucella abortus]URR42654.1 2-polyprenylphenol 6-hydroxylase [Brucella abortus]URR45795.1 2-polyprenylphenol 6-hydroxylase [Brucella abortus]URR52083.1 2-polyprenylphenol 6-hydroxylase [Brucella abortus]URR64696.1 2-polyprenylphenol 6-hydroxylase [Brucella abortus]URR67850.1 2-polyprenylphenol 6-hydroxylase [Brucella abortus]